TQNIGFTWDVLDFGLSYIRAKQQADRYLIAKERERKVVHNIVQDVRKSYFRAVSAEKLLQKIEPLMKEASSALADAEKIEQVRAQSPMEALSYQRNLLEVLRTLQSLRQDLLTAKTDLSRLMGVKPGQAFKLAGFEEFAYKDMSIPFDLEFMEKVAIEQRPELIEAHYRERITLEETKAAMVRLLPGISLNAGAYYDDNAYLLNNDWQGIGAQVSWNLLNVFNVNNVDKVNELNKALVKEQAIASSMAVISQVHISNIRFNESRKNFKIADQYYEVSKRIGEQAVISNQMQNMGELGLIREKMNELLAELRRDVAYSDMQNSFGEIFTSIGLDLIDSGYKNKDLNMLSSEIDSKMQAWKTGSFTFEGSLAGEMAESKARVAQKNKPAVNKASIEETAVQNQTELAEPEDEMGLSVINFDLDSMQVTETEELESYLKKAVELGYKKVVITPYASKDTDKVNLPESYNRRLVMRRGMAVKRYIESLGVPLFVDMNILEGDAIYKERIAEIKAEK
ncbi:MAG: TolC family protein, partial [Thiomicrorhabdus sp.]|nr:TolC family protein [Thiomicrorhabdus sp.]